MAGNNPDCMHDAWDVAEQGQKNIEPELPPEADRKEDSDGRKQDSEKDAKKVAHGLLDVKLRRAGTLGTSSRSKVTLPIMIAACYALARR